MGVFLSPSERKKSSGANIFHAMYSGRGGCRLAENGICKEVYSFVNVPKTPLKA